MLWEIEIFPKDRNPDLDRVRADYDLLTHSARGREVLVAASRGYLVDADLHSEEERVRLADLLTDPLVEWSRMDRLNAESREHEDWSKLTVLPKPGVMDPVAESVEAVARELNLAVRAVRTFRRYQVIDAALASDREMLTRKVLGNDAIEQVVEGPLPDGPLAAGRPYEFRKIVVPIRDLDNEALERLSREGQLALTFDEMRTIRDHFRQEDRDPTDVELETLAQTWSEHCSHKTLKGRVECGDRVYENLLKETIFAATVEVRRQLGADDWCVSVFADNAGIVKFDDEHHVCFKVETHNRPSAIEPYGGANTGLGGVIRDVLGVGLGAKPIANTDVFCFASPFTNHDLPAGVLHPRKVMQGVVAGVRDYGNRMGIPTVNGAVLFDDRYLANPLVFCGTVGIMPIGCETKEVKAGDLIVAVGGRTGRDGIHGATFSSLSLSAESEQVSGGAVQIGNAIVEKKVMDMLLQARDRRLYRAVTDCGAGGFSSAVGEMGAELGAEVHLDRAPLKYDGLSYTEIWISEAQERMVLAVPPEKWRKLERLCAGEGVEATKLGTFEATGRLRLRYQGEQVGDLAMAFLHEGRPKKVLSAELKVLSRQPTQHSALSTQHSDSTDILKRILASPSVASKEWIIRQYDHEVQGGTVIKPLVGVSNDGPGDAAVITPILGSFRGLAIGCGINQLYGDLDPYAMAAAVIDEAVRNVVAVGADPSRVALLDNFCWGNVNDPEVLGTLVRACEACRDVAVAFRMPFISGKDSLHNEYRSGDRHIRIPGTLLISALGQVPDIRRCVTMDLKAAGNKLYFLGVTKPELGGSHYHLVTGQTGGEPPRVDTDLAPRLFRALHAAISQGVVRSCHDLSEGGLAVAAAEMAFAGGFGADITGARAAPEGDDVWLFSETTTRWLAEVEPDKIAAFEACFAGLPVQAVGTTTAEPRLRIAGAGGEWVVWAPLAELKAAWQSAMG